MKKLVISTLMAAACLFQSADAQTLKGKKIYLNPGHGGYEVSAGTAIPGQFGNGRRPDGSDANDRWNATIPFPSVTPDGCWESKHNLWRGLELERLLKAAGAEVMMSRRENRPEDDRIVSEIGAEATAWGADMFLSIHSNGNGANYLLGIFRGADPRPGMPFNINDPDLPESREMARTGWKHLHDNPLTCWQAQKDPTKPYCVADSAFYSGWTAGYHLGVLRKLWVPGYLAEIAFHDYKPEAHRMLNRDYSNAIAYMLYTGICEHFKAPMPTTGIVAGEVKDAKRIFRDPLYLGATFGDHDQYKPINGARVTLTGNGVNLSYTTDDYYNGLFYFPDLAPGTYKLKVEANGYTTIEQDVVCEAAKVRGPIVMMDDPSYDPAAHAGRANIYASELNVVAANTVRFTLNADATTVYINLIKDGKTLKTLDLGPQAKGNVTVTIPSTDLADGDYQWSIKAVADPISDEPLQFSEAGDPLLDIANARGISVDKNPASPYFGRVYVTSCEPNGKKGARMGQGIYILDAALSDVTGQGNKPYSGGVAWTGNSSPIRVFAAEDGKVWMCDWSDSHSGLWTMDPANPDNKFTEFFAGTRNADGLAKIGDAQIHGSIVDMCVVGTGKDTKLYTIDEDIVTTGILNYQGAQAMNLPYRYDIGDVKSDYDKAPDKCFGNYDTKYVNGSATINPDGRGGLWIGQNRDANGAQFPSAMHINAKGEWDYNCGDPQIFKTSTPMGALGVSADGKYVAVAGKTDIRVAEAAYDENGKPALTLKWVIGSTYGARPFACDIDAAGNVYVAFNDNGGGVGAWALPKENNEFTTLANSALRVSAGVDFTTVDKAAIYFDGTTVTAAGMLVEVFTVSGVKVAEGYAIDTTDFAAGLYIVRAGSESIKIVK